MKRWTAILSVLLLLVLVAATPAAAQGGGGEYLALGDSIPFGFSPLLDKQDAANFIGYPEAVAASLNLQLTNPTCPGEASGGFISPTGPDNNCRPYRAANPLHVAYTTAQLDYAVAFLRGHPRVRLVTIQLGGNDFFIVRKGCVNDFPGAPAAIEHCIIAGLPAAKEALAANLEAIYGRIRGEGRYQGALVAVNSYATDYRDTAPVNFHLMNAVVEQITAKYGGVVADAYGTFLRAAAPSGGDPCAAGLLIRKADGTCDLHPAPVGRDLVAGAVLRALANPRPFFIRRLGDG